MHEKLTIEDIPIQGKKVLMRVDFNVPLDEEGNITDDTRILSSLPSIKYVLDHGGSIILMSHLGRPKGKKEEKYSLKPVAKRLQKLLGVQVKMAPDCIGKEVETLCQDLSLGEVILLENLRFHEGEENPEKDPSFAKNLAKLGDVYVNDAFGTAHRSHSSTTEIASYFPKKAAAGFLLKNEITYLGMTLLEPSHPFIAIVGGAKISSKIGILKAMMKKADILLIGGGMTYTFLKAQGHSIGKSICEDQYLETAKEIMQLESEENVSLILPVDLVVAEKIDPHAKSYVIEIQEGIPPNYEGVDIGPKTIELFSKEIKKAATVFWNGPLGVFECPPFAKGTFAVAQVLSNHPAIKIIGGGDSVSAVKSLGIADKMTHISTGGGASLEYIEQGTLPGIEALSDKE